MWYCAPHSQHRRSSSRTRQNYKPKPETAAADPLHAVSLVITAITAAQQDANGRAVPPAAAPVMVADAADTSRVVVGASRVAANHEGLLQSANSSATMTLRAVTVF
ncbi:hypothetical protein MRX96_018741 [Rhipicephalus microplus]